jgi:hypothetical protein
LRSHTAAASTNRTSHQLAILGSAAIKICQVGRRTYGQGATRLEAAEAAWTKSQDEPWLGRDDRPA